MLRASKDVSCTASPARSPTRNGLESRRRGHSVEVLLRIYAKCLDGGDALIRQRVQAALGYADTDNDNGEVTGSNPATPTTPPDQVVSQS